MTYILPNGPFTVRMDHEPVQVITIPTADIPRASWWLTREYCVKWTNKPNFNSILLDNDGLSIICDTTTASSLQLFNIDTLKVSPQKWISLTVQVTGLANELPGVVFYLAHALSKEGLSILHISTFDAEVFLVQEHDIDSACKILKTNGNLKQYSEIVGRNQRQNSSDNHQYPKFDLNSSPLLSEPVSNPSRYEGFSLQVMPRTVMLTKLNSEQFSMSDCGSIMLKLLLYDIRFSPTERSLHRTKCRTSKRISKAFSPELNVTSLTTSQQSAITSPVTPEERSTHVSAQSINHPFMWGIWQNGDEITFLLEEADIRLFPEGSLTVSPQHWKVIKLVGREIDFDETGIVSAMSQIDTGIPALNISTALTNCTLVPVELLDNTLDNLAALMNIPIDIVES